MGKQASRKVVRKKVVAAARSRRHSAASSTTTSAGARRRTMPPTVQQLSRRDMIRFIDTQAREHFGISGRTFIQRARRGELPDTGLVTHLKLIAGV